MQYWGRIAINALMLGTIAAAVIALIVALIMLDKLRLCV